ncbi:hypothetical protein JX265_006635 [Neoarthrinium moseri]|uniref:Uncharacterized protein n=1 Tax=Neoarthrinium moseri TaxID=1658444 RepID=A0A9P9WLX7_9PEZI|nr:hypothetical protein JX266_000089 [Neoarthrinium moseri]KAI1869545.1 hypothetical protein JX265_006635 [Neoarthrinium moseri]
MRLKGALLLEILLPAISLRKKLNCAKLVEDTSEWRSPLSSVEIEYQAFAIHYFSHSTLDKFEKGVLGSTDCAEMPRAIRELDDNARLRLDFLALERQDTTRISLTRILKQQGDMMKSILEHSAAKADRAADSLCWMSSIPVHNDHLGVRRRLGDAHLSSGRRFLTDENAQD